MKPLPTEGYSGLYFTTATIKGWKHLLKPDKYKTIHLNPTQEKWRLAGKAQEYVYSSASLYILGDRRWPFLRHFAV